MLQPTVNASSQFLIYLLKVWTLDPASHYASSATASILIRCGWEHERFFILDLSLVQEALTR
jgi:hypothetical protein